MTARVGSGGVVLLALMLSASWASHACGQTSPSTVLAQAESLYVAGQSEAARRVLFPEIARGSTHPGVLTLYGFILAAAYRYHDAERVFAQVIEQDSSAVGAQLGVAMVERATFRYHAAENRYQYVLRLDPENRDARHALQALEWERRYEAGIGGGWSAAGSQRGGIWEAHVRAHVSPAIDAVLTVARNAFQDIGVGTPALGAHLVDAPETQVAAGFAYRPTPRLTVGTTILYSRILGEGSILLWPEAAVSVHPRLSLIAGVRPVYDGGRSQWALAASGGVSLHLPHRQGLTLRALLAARDELESPMTLLANYEAQPRPNLQVQLGAGYGNGSRYQSFNISGQAKFMLTPRFGLRGEYSQRFRTFTRYATGAGIVVAW